MKHLKKYENSKINTPDFEEGDYVICIDDENSILTKDMRYLVKKIFKNKNNYYSCKVTSKLGKIGENLGTFLCDRFISEIKYNIMLSSDLPEANRNWQAMLFRYKEEISATMLDGILTVSIPKLKEDKKKESFKITIK